MDKRFQTMCILAMAILAIYVGFGLQKPVETTSNYNIMIDMLLFALILATIKD